MKPTPLYVSIAKALDAIYEPRRYLDLKSPWETDWTEYLERCCKVLPQSEFNDVPRTRVVVEMIRPNRILIVGAYIEMTGVSTYTSTDYVVKVVPSLARGFVLHVRCRDRRVRDLVEAVYEIALAKEYFPSEFCERKEKIPHVLDRAREAQAGNFH